MSEPVPPLPPRIASELRGLLGDSAVLTEPSDCWPYGYDNSRRQALPRAVVFAAGHGQVLELVRLCNREGLKLVPRGRGTGTTGATVPLDGALVVSMERMDGLLEVDPANRIARVGPGVTNQALQEAAADRGFFWPPDPTSAAACTVGGNLAYNAAGPRAVKYGTPRENTLGLRAVTGAGEEIRTGTATTKGVVGYDLTRLIIGSEGTLAVVTEALLRLTPLPEAKRTLRADYGDIRAAARAVSAIMAQPVTPCALELMDGACLDLVRRYEDAGVAAAVEAVLLIEVDGPAHCIEEAARAVQEAARVDGCVDVHTAASAEEVDRLWRVRKALSPALRNAAPKKINEDVVVPVSHIPELVGRLQALSRESGLQILNFGHAGNGNIHVNILLDPADPQQLRAGERCLEALFNMVLALGGTLSGEHGVGLEKREFVDREIDPVTLRLMRDIKARFDPNDVLNPGKGFPAR